MSCARSAGSPAGGQLDARLADRARYDRGHCDADFRHRGGAIYVFDAAKRELQLSATFGMSAETIAAVREMHAEIYAAVGLLRRDALKQRRICASWRQRG